MYDYVWELAKLVDRRTGGLEIPVTKLMPVSTVDRRTGGLESKTESTASCSCVDRRTGGLETSVAVIPVLHLC